jgi:hypothetical protein
VENDAVGESVGVLEAARVQQVDPRLQCVFHDQQLSGGAFVTQLDTDPQTTAPRLSDLNQRERNNLFARVQERLPVVWEFHATWTLRMSRGRTCRRSALTDERVAPGAWGKRSRNGSCSCCYCQATAVAHDLRHVDADQAEHR